MDRNRHLVRRCLALAVVGSALAAVGSAVPRGQAAVVGAAHRATAPAPSRIADLPPDEMIDFETLWTMGGSVGAVVVDGGVTYLAVGPSLVALTAPEWNVAAERIGGLQWSTGDIGYLAPDGAQLYAALGDISLGVIDVSDPTQLSLQAFIGFDGILGVEAAGGYLYVLDRAGLHVWFVGDLSAEQPTDLSELAVLDLPGDGLALDMAGQHAYVAGGSAGLTIVDLEDPAWPQIEGVLAVGGSATAVAVAGDLAYVAAGTALVLVDVSTPGAPREVGRFVADQDVKTVAVQGATAYLGQAFGGLVVVDVGVPEAPTWIRTAQDPAGFARCAGVNVDVAPQVAFASDNTAYVAWQGHLSAMEEASGTLGWSYDSDMSCVESLAAQGHRVYVGGRAHGQNQLFVVDVLQPWAPGIASVTPVTGSNAMAVDGDLVALARDSGLDLLDVSDPAHPQQLGSCALPYVEPQDLTMVDGLAYVTGGANSLTIVDVRDPLAPRQVGTYGPVDDVLWGVAVAGGRAYVTRAHGLLVLDVSKPGQPTLVGSIDLPGETRAVQYYQGRAYVVDAFGTGDVPGRLHVVDVGDPATPRLITSLDVPTNARLAMVDDLAVVVGYEAVAFDVSDATAPTEVGGGGHAVDPVDVASLGGDPYMALYMARSAHGLYGMAMPTYSPGAYEVLDAVADLFADPPISCPPDLSRENGVYKYDCAVAAGHSISIWLEPFADGSAAETAWDERRGVQDRVLFHGHPAFYQQFDEQQNPNLPLRHRLYVWQAGRWVVTVEARDDTGIPLADPIRVSEIAYSAGVLAGLWADLPGPGQAGEVYLPIAGG